MSSDRLAGRDRRHRERGAHLGQGHGQSQRVAGRLHRRSRRRARASARRRRRADLRLDERRPRDEPGQPVPGAARRQPARSIEGWTADVRSDRQRAPHVRHRRRLEGGHPIDVPIFVVTHEAPTEGEWSPQVRFVTDGLERAVELAREAAGDKDVSVCAADPVQQLLRAGLLDEIEVSVTPVPARRRRAAVRPPGAEPDRPRADRRHPVGRRDPPALPRGARLTSRRHAARRHRRRAHRALGFRAQTASGRGGEGRREPRAAGGPWPATRAQPAWVLRLWHGGQRRSRLPSVGLVDLGPRGAVVVLDAQRMAALGVGARRRGPQQGDALGGGGAAPEVGDVDDVDASGDERA